MECSIALYSTNYALQRDDLTNINQGSFPTGVNDDRRVPAVPLNRGMFQWAGRS